MYRLIYAFVNHMLVIRIPFYDAHAASDDLFSCSTFCILMEFPMDIDTIKIGLFIVYCMGHRQIFFLKYDVFPSLGYAYL